MTVNGTLPPDDPRHGTQNGYTNWRCRCEPCRAANSATHLEYMHRTGRHRPWNVYREALLAERRPIAHGTEGGYNRCRKEDAGPCNPCRDAAAQARRRRRAANPIAARNADRAFRGASPYREIGDPDLALVRRAAELEHAVETLKGELRDLALEQADEDSPYAPIARFLVSLDALVPFTDADGVASKNTRHDVLGYGSRFLSGYVSDSWTEAVCAVVDWRREIDGWGETYA